MGVNRERPHVEILVEDDANRQILNGFSLHHAYGTQVHIPKVAGGWPKVRAEVAQTYVRRMRQNPHLHLILVVDFDERDGRYETIFSEVPDDLKARVMLIGAKDDPQALARAARKSREALGQELAEACFERIDGAWGSDHLAHNAEELRRVGETMRNLIFRTER
jgi:hypothetical protein